MHTYLSNYAIHPTKYHSLIQTGRWCIWYEANVADTVAKLNLTVGRIVWSLNLTNLSPE